MAEYKLINLTHVSLVQYVTQQTEILLLNNQHINIFQNSPIALQKTRDEISSIPK